MNDLTKSPEFIEREFKTKLLAVDLFVDKAKRMNRAFEMLAEDEVHRYEWDDVYRFIDSICRDSKFSSIYGVPRGGLIIALLLSYRTGKPIVSHPCDGCIVVEDAATTGTSLLPYSMRFDIACMYVKEACPVTVKYLYDTDAEWKAVKFPWQN